MRLYRALLRLLPASFRAEYGREMAAIFARRHAEATGPRVRAALWLETLADLLRTALFAHLDLLRQDLRYTGRTLRRSPGFTVMAVLMAGLGIGATTATFSTLDHVLIRPLPFPQPDRLVKLWQDQSFRGYSRMEVSPANYRDYKAQATSFEAMAAYRGLSVNLVGEGYPQRLEGASLNAEVFPILRQRPLLGRSFQPSDDREGAPGTVLLSHGLWQTVFGGDPWVVGRKVALDGTSHVVIGVMPAGFHFPNREAQLWTPMRFTGSDFEDRSNVFLHVLARLRPGVTIDQARAEMSVIAGRLERAYPVENERTGVSVFSLRDQVGRQARLLLMALTGAALGLLLIACTNLAGLLLARSLQRRRELAVRTALGAGRERLLRQLLTESLVISLAGGLLGVLIASAATPLLVSLVPNGLPIAEAPALDLRLLALALGLTLLTGVGFGAVPALRAARQVDTGALREGRATTGIRRERARSLLVTVQITLSVGLLISTGLLVRALWQVQAVDPGFDAGGVLTLRTSLPMPKYEQVALREQFYRRVISDARALPGVTDAAYISFLPMVMRGGIWPIKVVGSSERPGIHTASLRYVTPGFFQTLRIPLRQGRDIRTSDSQQAPYVAVVSESFARRHFPGRNPLGQRFEIGLAERTIVGVVGDIRVRGLERTSEPQVYVASPQAPDGGITWYAPKDLIVRTRGEPTALLPALRRIIAAADPQQPISDVQTLAEIVAEDSAPRAAQVRLLGAFAAIAVLLAAIGIHGLLAFSVSSRTQEIGVRIALGADRSHVLALVLRRALLLAGAGLAAGMLLASAAGRGLQALLAGVSPADGLTYAAAVAVAVTMTVAGSLLPALRALRVDPLTAIRAE
jgi:putative ABC transport system permease protein